MRKSSKALWISAALFVLVLAATLVLSACTGPVGPAGAPGAPGAAGTSTGKVAGKVTNTLTKAGVSGVAVTTDPAIPNLTITTDASGSYSADLPIGPYTLTFKKTGYDNGTQAASVVAGITSTKDVALKPTKNVSVSAGAAVASKPEATVTLKATAEAFDGSTISTYEWSQVSGVAARLDGKDSATATVTLSKEAAYKLHLVEALENIERVKVVGINPHLLIDAETTQFKVTVTTSSGKYSATVNVTAELPLADSTGLPVVGKETPVLLQGKTQATYDWAITAAPANSKAALRDATTRYPFFNPDLVGKYTVTEKKSGATLDVWAGTWSTGAISALDDKGEPLSTGCTICHDDKTASNNFKEWRLSGHAEIFQQNVDNPAGHWTESCALCHTVGYNKSATNGGWDEAMAAEKWVVPSHGDIGLYKSMFATFPKTAALSNIQCENCHGPNDGTGLHPNQTLDAARISLSSDVCGSCHGEPPRHGRFQQWETSGHGNFELATDEGGSTNCARCHTSQGFLQWLKQGDLTKALQGANGNMTAAELAKIVTKDTALPQTCATCHDPHKLGTTSGEPNDVILRVQGSTPMLPSGYKAENVGNGAMCITCHNTRNGAKSDAVLPTAYQAPHTAAQGDVLMGQNAYFVNTPMRSPHAAIKNTCTACHMEETPPPAQYSNQGAGTNHSFAATLTICSSCHTKALDGNAFILGEEEQIAKLGKAMSDTLLKRAGVQFFVQDYTPHAFAGKDYDVRSNAIQIQTSNIASVEPTEPHGQQGFLFTLKTPITVTYAPTGETPHTASVTILEVQLGNITTDGTKAVVAPSDPLVRVGWNYWLLHGDGSGGIHNPAFASEIISSSMNALK